MRRRFLGIGNSALVQIIITSLLRLVNNAIPPPVTATDNVRGALQDNVVLLQASS